MTVKKMGNVYICGDRSTDSSQGHPPMAPRVTQCAAMMAEIILDLTLQNPTEHTKSAIDGWKEIVNKTPPAGR
jgi:hypothetical protein